MSGAISVEIIRTRIGESVRLLTWWNPSFPRRKQTNVALAQILLAVCGAQRRLPAHDEQPLLVRMVRVVRPELVAGLELVHARADQLGLQPSADPRVLGAPAVALLGAIPFVRIEVDDAHRGILRSQPSSSGNSSIPS